MNASVAQHHYVGIPQRVSGCVGECNELEKHQNLFKDRTKKIPSTLCSKNKRAFF
jgi:hypothetical protein